MAAQGDLVEIAADLVEVGPSEGLAHLAALVLAQVQAHGLGVAAQIDDHNDPLVLKLPHEGQDTAVVGPQPLDLPAPEHLKGLTLGQQLLGPVQQTVGILLLAAHVDPAVAVLGVANDGQVQAMGVSLREAGVLVVVPLHGGAHAVAVAQVVVVAHADLVAVVEHGGAGQRHQQHVEQLDLVAVVVHQRGQPAADAQVDARRPVRGVDVVHEVALLVGDHLQGQLVVVPEEGGPLAVLGDLRGLVEDVGDGVAVLHFNAHVHPGHEREVVVHVALITVAEVAGAFFGPHIGLGQEEHVVVVIVDVLAQFFEELVGLGQVLAVGALALEEVGDGVEPEAVDAHAHPVIQDLEDLLLYVGAVVVQVGLVVEEAVPVVLLGHGVPGPVARLGIRKDDADVGVLFVVVAPDVIVALGAVLRGPPCPLEPLVLVGGVVDDQLRDHLEVAGVGGVQEAFEVL